MYFSQKSFGEIPSYTQFILVFVVLLLGVASLATLVTVSPPHLTRTTQTGDLRSEQFTMYFSGTLRDTKDFTITPNIPHEVNFQANYVSIRFDAPLSYGTTYDVQLTIEDTRGKTASIHTYFATEQRDFYYTSRLPDGDDTLYFGSLRADTSDQALLRAETILMSARSSSSVAIIAVDSDASQELMVYRSEKDTHTSALPEGRRARHIRGSSTRDHYVLTLVNEKTFVSEIWIYDASTQKIKQVTIQNEPAQGAEATYAPDGETIYFIDPDNGLQLYIPDTNDSAFFAGNFESITRYLPNERAIYGYSSFRPISILTASGEKVSPPQDVILSEKSILLNDTQSYVYITRTLNQNEDTLTQQLNIRQQSGDIKELIHYDTTKTLITGLSVSPNDQYVVTETAAQPVIYETLLANSKPKDVTSMIYDRESGTPLRTLQGFDILWE